MILTLLAAAALAAAPAAEWLIPPAPAFAAKSGWKNVRFSVDGRGRPWLVHGRRNLVCPVDLLEMTLIAPADGLVHVDNASPLVSARGFLGNVPILDMVENDERGRPRIPFNPLRRMPRAGCSLAPGAKGAIYALCRHGAEHELYVLRKGKDNPFVLLLRSSEAIRAAAGDGDSHFASVGPAVLKVAQPLQPLFRHPSGPVRDLAYDPKAGLFYAAAGEVGRFAGDALEPLVQAPRSQIRFAGDSLYVFSEADWGIAKLSGF